MEGQGRAPTWFGLFTRDAPVQVAFGGLAASGLGLVAAPVIARLLGPAGRGATATAIATGSLVSIVLAIGVPLEIRRLAARGPCVEAIRSARDLVIASVAPSVIAGYILGMTIFADLHSADRVVAMAAVAAAPFTFSWIIDTSVLVANSRFRAVFLLRVSQPFIFIVVTLAHAGIWSASFRSVVLAHVASNAITALVGLALVRVSVRGARVSHRELLSRGLTYAGSATAEAASNRLDQVLMLPVIGGVQSGLYSVAATVALVPVTLAHAIGSSYFRELANLKASEATALIHEAIQSAAALAIVSCTLLAAVTPWAIPLFFGSDFEGAVSATLIALAGSLALMIAFVSSLALAARAEGFRMTLGQVISLAVGVSLLLLLGPAYGAVGAAMASSAAYVALMVTLLGFLRVPPGALLPTPATMRRAVHRLAH